MVQLHLNPIARNYISGLPRATRQKEPILFVLHHQRSGMLRPPLSLLWIFQRKYFANVHEPLESQCQTLCQILLKGSLFIVPTNEQVPMSHMKQVKCCKQWWHLMKFGCQFLHQVAACVPDMFRSCYIMGNKKIANNSTITEAREKIISTVLEPLEFLMYVWKI